MKIQRSLNNLHPILIECVKSVQKDIIDAHNIPIRLFETSRDHDRHEMLVQRGKTKNIISHHLYDLKNEPPLYTTAIDYVYFDTKWSWNLRDSTTTAWYILFGNLVLDLCPELQWSGMNRKSINYCHFELKRETVLNNISKVPCVI